ncbi:MAG: CRTAC1 family protein [Gammaproteobacteria bacterium]|nr:MAG: CRTAC1 family protein [Gammaproteobacteria bacterium]
MDDRYRGINMAILILLILLTAGTAQAQIQFVEVTQSSGIYHADETWGAGAWGDVNGDDWPDLWTNNHTKPGSLYVNQQNGTFVDEIATRIPNYVKNDEHGAAWADFDRDGDQDLIVLVGASQGKGSEPNHLFVNNGGIMTDDPYTYGLDYPLSRGRTPLWFDANNDGLLDVLTTAWKRLDAMSDVFINNGVSFQPILTSIGIQQFPSLYAQLADLTGDGILDLVVYSENFPQSVWDYAQSPPVEVQGAINMPTTSFVQDSVFADFNNDLLTDYYVSRGPGGYGAKCVDVMNSNELRLTVLPAGNEEGASFVTSGVLSLDMSAQYFTPMDFYIGSQGIHPITRPVVLDPADPNVVGIKPHTPGVDYGVYMGYDPYSNMWTVTATFPNLNKAQFRIDSTAPISSFQAIGFHESLGHDDQLMLKSISGQFIQVPLAGVRSRSVVAGDFDNDMDVDLYVVQSRGCINQPNVLLENDGTGTFTPVPAAGGAQGATLGIGDHVSTVDFDRDGFLDLYVTNGDAYPVFAQEASAQLFRNTGNANHWLEIDLKGGLSNIDGIGTQVFVTAGGVTQVRAMDGGMHRFTQNHSRLHFGLGANAVADTVEIHWPNGKIQTFTGVPADRLYKVDQAL